MIEFISENRDWFEVIHIIAVISWMAGMLYLPRLFIYHCQVEVGSESSELFKVMERRLLRAIINPAMIVAFIFGVLLAWESEFYIDGWFHVKFTAALAIAAIHGWLSRCRKAFLRDDNQKSEIFYRVINEVITLLMVIIVIMVVLKPF